MNTKRLTAERQIATSYKIFIDFTRSFDQVKLVDRVHSDLLQEQPHTRIWEKLGSFTKECAAVFTPRGLMDQLYCGPQRLHLNLGTTHSASRLLFVDNPPEGS